ncbi:MAG TPA: DNA/RNA non-specific endonuclease [Pyrinomonadaceae bacterium]|nr:DNA/RNA non-specific endonuclease [Pyrinomonadaceae bacterium]
MNNKTLIGGAIALGIIVLILILCFWVGKKTINVFREPDNTNITQPNGQPPNASNLPQNDAQAQKTYLALGNPSNASTSDPNNYMLVNNYMVISYSRDRGIPNWVAWRVSKADLGQLDREDSFRPDDRLPKNWTRITPTDYTGSGFDRGHVCPNADRYSSREAADSTFVMTNMTPQTGDLNRGPWQKLEAYLRTLVTRGSDVYIYAGVYGEKGKIKKKVTIPTNSWKIAVAVPAGSDILSANEKTRVIAVDMPNVKGILNSDWQTYRTTVNQIEQNTGYKFFSTLPPNVQSALKSKTDNINN